MSENILSRVNSPESLKAVEDGDLPLLCTEIRQFLVRNIAKTGGHLAANLGIVEISVALHRLFDAPQDKIIYDVGHQCYVHKILTGRKDDMEHIRSYGGISGFLRPGESRYDEVVSGHASTSISSGIGLLRGMELMGESGRVVCVIGDGAMTGGMAYEALNDAGQSGKPLIVIYNDNEMSISKNVGALTRKMSGLRVRPRYFKTKKFFKSLFGKLPMGEYLISGARNTKNFVKQAVLKESIFEILGFNYLGPCDGNDIDTVLNVLQEAKGKNKPVVIHFKTLKGKGYRPSEEHPESYHGVSPFDISTGEALKYKNHNFSKALGNKLCQLAQSDKRICAVTAAMTEGTGLLEFSQQYPERFFDVGIAEEHGVTMTAALAKSGLVPFFAVYATFLQRGYDQLIHDVCIEGLHAVFAVDRSGITGEDGETHQGTFDIPQLSVMPGLTILAPSTYDELDAAIDLAVNHFTGPVALRYARGVQREYKENHFSLDPVVLRPGSDITIVSYGILINEALGGVDLLAAQGISAELLKLNNLSGGYMDAVVASVKKTGRLIVLEECMEQGSIGQKILAQLALMGIAPGFAQLLNIKDRFVTHGGPYELYREAGIDRESLCKAAVMGVRHGKGTA